MLNTVGCADLPLKVPLPELFSRMMKVYEKDVDLSHTERPEVNDLLKKWRFRSI